jgi:predicted alpha/beta superfamily hydrolase
MKSYLFTIIACLFLISCMKKQDTELKFVLHSPDLSSDSTVYITGSSASLGNWNPKGLQMSYTGNQLWEATIPYDSSQIIEYKYTLGSWSTENADANGLPLPNFEWKAGKDNPKKDQVLFWRNSNERVINGQITGTVEYHKNISAEGLLPRDLIVWLPEGYAKGTETYPVLYMHDGQNIIDPVISSFGVDWEVDETMTSMIASGDFPPAIVVGIYNTAQRTQDYTPGSQSHNYLLLIRNTIKPLIDRNYRTKKEREYTFIGGSSYGGMISMQAIWEHSDIFSAALCFSPAFKTEAYNYVERVANTAETPEDIFIYMINGGVGLEAILQPGIDEMLSILNSKGLLENEHWIFKQELEARHFEADWARQFPDALRTLQAHLKKRK